MNARNQLLNKEIGQQKQKIETLRSALANAAAGVADVKLGTEVVSAYSDYEQLVGGIDTLFKYSSAEMQKYAANAYKTADIWSADCYLALHFV